MPNVLFQLLEMFYFFIVLVYISNAGLLMCNKPI